MSRALGERQRLEVRVGARLGDQAAERALSHAPGRPAGGEDELLDQARQGGVEVRAGHGRRRRLATRAEVAAEQLRPVLSLRKAMSAAAAMRPAIAATRASTNPL